VHVGYDYYMYVAVSHAVPQAVSFAQQVGLFAEPFESPYRIR
jgi:hypothetical protein